MNISETSFNVKSSLNSQKNTKPDYKQNRNKYKKTNPLIPEDYTTSISFDEGYKPVMKNIETKKIIASIGISEDEMNYHHNQGRWQIEHEHSIKDSLANLLVEQLKKSEYIEYQKYKSPELFGSTTFTAKINVADMMFTNTTVITKGFVFNDEEWDDAEIKHALKKTYPERFI